jgi:hypothetical protein
MQIRRRRQPHASDRHGGKRLIVPVAELRLLTVS